MAAIAYGIDVVVAEKPAWSDLRIALLTNEAATTSGFVPSRRALLDSGFKLTRLFSPEHGLQSVGADGHAMPDGVDPLTGLPVVSLYGDRLAPGADDLADIDLVLVDIPDIGCRYYTYLWTLTLVMEACAAAGKPMVILDRPNPLSGDLSLAEGPMLDEGRCSSFIGRWRMPVRHSCTLGELAMYFNAVRGIGVDLQVVVCPGWKRDVFVHERKSFVPSSPAMSSFESVLWYPGTCLLEATNLSLGRGTGFPFRVAGAPWLRAMETAEMYNRLAKAVFGHARAVRFQPTEGPHAGVHCSGIMMHSNDFHTLRPVAAGYLLLWVLIHLHPGDFQWAPYPTHVNYSGRGHLDLLLGIPAATKLFENQESLSWSEIEHFTQIPGWADMIRPFRLYC